MPLSQSRNMLCHPVFYTNLSDFSFHSYPYLTPAMSIFSSYPSLQSNSDIPHTLLSPLPIKSTMDTNTFNIFNISCCPPYRSKQNKGSPPQGLCNLALSLVSKILPFSTHHCTLDTALFHPLSHNICLHLSTFFEGKGVNSITKALSFPFAYRNPTLASKCSLNTVSRRKSARYFTSH